MQILLNKPSKRYQYIQSDNAFMFCLLLGDNGFVKSSTQLLSNVDEIMFYRLFNSVPTRKNRY
jgi:hypothetical protein